MTDTQAQVEIRFQLDGEAVSLAQIDDEDLLDLFEHTADQLQHEVKAKLSAAPCPSHASIPSAIVTVQYDRETMQMELSYHVDACCQLGLLRAVAQLNH